MQIKTTITTIAVAACLCACMTPTEQPPTEITDVLTNEELAKRFYWYRTESTEEKEEPHYEIVASDEELEVLKEAGKQLYLLRLGWGFEYAPDEHDEEFIYWYRIEKMEGSFGKRILGIDGYWDRTLTYDFFDNLTLNELKAFREEDQKVFREEHQSKMTFDEKQMLEEEIKYKEFVAAKAKAQLEKLQRHEEERANNLDGPGIDRNSLTTSRANAYS